MRQHVWDFCKFCFLYGQVVLIVLGALFFYSASNPAWLGEVVGGHMIAVGLGSLLGIWWMTASQPKKVKVPPPQPRYVRSSYRVESAA